MYSENSGFFLHFINYDHNQLFIYLSASSVFKEIYSVFKKVTVP